MRPAPAWLRNTVLLLGIYGFVIGDVWLGSRVYLGLIVQAQAGGLAAAALLAQAAAHNEPLIAVVRVAIGLASLLFAGAVLGRVTLYPPWMAAFRSEGRRVG